jgi:hypothetical protein
VGKKVTLFASATQGSALHVGRIPQQDSGLDGQILDEHPTASKHGSEYPFEAMSNSYEPKLAKVMLARSSSYSMQIEWRSSALTTKCSAHAPQSEAVQARTISAASRRQSCLAPIALIPVGAID